MDSPISYACLYKITAGVAGLYSAALDAHQGKAAEPVYRSLGEIVLADVSELCRLHDDPSMALEAKGKTATRVSVLQKRFANIQHLVNLWLDDEVWIRVLLRCEYAWQRLLTKLSAQNDIQAHRLEPFLASSLDRKTKLQHLQAGISQRVVTLTENYAIPVSLEQGP